MPYLSIIISNQGSEQLYYSICALREQMRPMDELIVVSNGRHPESRKIVLSTIGNRPNVWYIETEASANSELGKKNGWQRARGVRILFLSDKDLIVRGALDLVREKAEEFDSYPLLFLSKKISGKTSADILVPYNKWTGKVDTESIIKSQGNPVLINEVVALSEVLIDPI